MLYIPLFSKDKPQVASTVRTCTRTIPIVLLFHLPLNFSITSANPKSVSNLVNGIILAGRLIWWIWWIWCIMVTRRWCSCTESIFSGLPTAYAGARPMRCKDGKHSRTNFNKKRVLLLKYQPDASIRPLGSSEAKRKTGKWRQAS